MHNLVDTIFAPLLAWLTSIADRLHSLSVPVAKPINLSNYFGAFAMLGPYWMTLITTICGLSFLYLMTYLIMANIGLVVKFKNLIKWW